MPNDKEENRIEVSVSGDGISIKRNVDEHIARDIVNILMGGTAAYIPNRSGRSQGSYDTEDRSDQSDRSRRMSLREYLDESQASRNPDKITVIGEFISEFEGRSEFSRDDIKSRFKQAGEAPPGNFGRDFAWAVSNGWVAEDTKNPGAYYVTNKGREAIEAKFASEVAKATRQKSGSRRRSSRRNAEDQISGNE